MIRNRGVHGEKLVALGKNTKLPNSDTKRVDAAIKKYDNWILKLNAVEGKSIEEVVFRMVSLLNEYKKFIDVELIFDSTEDFLYRQKGQLKLDNTVMEEFLPILVRKCLNFYNIIDEMEISSQTKVYSSLFFESSIKDPRIGGGITLKVKDQDFSISRKLHLRASYDKEMKNAEEVISIETNLGYVLAEMKTNLDKTMFQEASATARDVKMAVTGAKYYLICDYLDMTPISSATTNIDEVLILRKAKRLSSNIRKVFSTYKGRVENREFYIKYLEDYPYSSHLFLRLINQIIREASDTELNVSDVLEEGYF